MTHAPDVLPEVDASLCRRQTGSLVHDTAIPEIYNYAFSCLYSFGSMLRVTIGRIMTTQG